MVDVNADLTEGLSQNSTPLTYAIFNSKYDEESWLIEVSSLIEMGADVNKKDKHRWSPLMMAVRFRNHKIVKILLDNGADPDWGQPLSVAI